ncbi:hypothetical protein [Chitinophaga ginsengisegetis]|uniref:hypothetical protein n=1 Tax=Chitinophaga ginsengisegetis TaxID=393003 RepID=UPI000DBA3B18|nr:hypothetical protein [Chitinophaga ginsengisegetis]MDR6571022.1 hypothetical protein [Chitinophaga ginsengisegetis]MDR6650756.1 hypothetical protein [Chitinophaga ginsengisegetis]MDR6657106.1 hypothetical protein [Chitinophaga ginsengisegetis]
MQTVITKRELQVPVDVLIRVADVLLENDITNSITGTDEEDGYITVEVEYEKEQRDAIHEAEDIISDYHENEEDEDEDEEDEDED